jgi:hypothetical protein
MDIQLMANDARFDLSFFIIYFGHLFTQNAEF